jgi:hypothetical protein
MGEEKEKWDIIHGLTVEESNVKKCYFGLLDVLGFSDMIKNRPLEEIKHFYLRYFIFYENFATKQMKAVKISEEEHKVTLGIEYYELSRVKFTHFSDSIMFWTEDATCESFSEICEAVGGAIYYALHNHENPVVLRGAITLNENLIIPKLNTFIGKGVVQAYEYSNILESGGAIVPHSSGYGDCLSELLEKEILCNFEVHTKYGKEKFAVVNILNTLKGDALRDDKILTLKHNLQSIKTENRNLYAEKSISKYMEYNRKLSNTTELIEILEECSTN